MPSRDRNRRLNVIRKGREKGARIYIPEEELLRAGYKDPAAIVSFRVWGGMRGGVLLRFYKQGDMIRDDEEEA